MGEPASAEVPRRHRRRLSRWGGRHFVRRQLNSYALLRWVTALVFFAVTVLAPAGMLRTATAADESLTAQESNLLAAETDGQQRRGQRSRRENQQRAQFLASWLLWRAELAEPEVTATLQEVAAGTAVGRGWELKGLEYRLKRHDSLARKILADAEADAVSVEQAADGIGDVLRYTLVCAPEVYTAAVPQALGQLAAQGYRVTKFRNAWGGRFYQGINVHLLSPDGLPLELQLHTPQSFAIKQASHAVYEIRRSPRSTPAEKAAAVRQSLAYNAQVVPPPGVEHLQWPQAA